MGQFLKKQIAKHFSYDSRYKITIFLQILYGCQWSDFAKLKTALKKCHAFCHFYNGRNDLGLMVFGERVKDIEYSLDLAEKIQVVGGAIDCLAFISPCCEIFFTEIMVFDQP